MTAFGIFPEGCTDAEREILKKVSGPKIALVAYADGLGARLMRLGGIIEKIKEAGLSERIEVCVNWDYGDEDVYSRFFKSPALRSLKPKDVANGAHIFPKGIVDSKEGLFRFRPDLFSAARKDIPTGAEALINHFTKTSPRLKVAEGYVCHMRALAALSKQKELCEKNLRCLRPMGDDASLSSIEESIKHNQTRLRILGRDLARPEVFLCVRLADTDFARSYKSFLPADDIAALVDKFYDDHHLGRDFFIGVQYRHGNGEKSVMPPPPKPIEKKIREILHKEKEEGKSVKILVCADCEAVPEHFSNLFGKDRVVFQDRYMRKRGCGPQHSLDVRTFNEGKFFLVDLFLLARANACIWSGNTKGGSGSSIEKILQGLVKGTPHVFHHRRIFRYPKNILPLSKELAQKFDDRHVQKDGLYVKDNFLCYYKLQYPENIDKMDMEEVVRWLKDYRLY